MTVMTYVTCSWCHRVCAQKDTRCPTCGHNPGVPRATCDCPECVLVTKPGLLSDGIAGGLADYGLLGDGGLGGLLGGLFPDPPAPDVGSPDPSPDFGGGGGFDGAGSGGDF